MNNLNQQQIKEVLNNLSRDFKNLPLSVFILFDEDEDKYNSIIGKLRGIIDIVYSGKEVKASDVINGKRERKLYSSSYMVVAYNYL